MADTCAHEVCHCERKDEAEFCGTHCSEAALHERKPVSCECGHIDCEEATMRTGGVYTTGRPVQ